MGIILPLGDLSAHRNHHPPSSETRPICLRASAGLRRPRRAGVQFSAGQAQLQRRADFCLTYELDSLDRSFPQLASFPCLGTLGPFTGCIRIDRSSLKHCLWPPCASFLILTSLPFSCLREPIHRVTHTSWRSYTWYADVLSIYSFVDDISVITARALSLSLSPVRTGGGPGAHSLSFFSAHSSTFRIPLPSSSITRS
jgi:hypothetical protein